MQVARACRGTPQADRAARGAIIVMNGNIRGLPFITWTWLAVPLLKPLPFRQASRRLGPNSDILVDFGVPKGVVKPCETTPGRAESRRTSDCDQRPTSWARGLPQLAPERKGAQPMPAQSAH